MTRRIALFACLSLLASALACEAGASAPVPQASGGSGAATQAGPPVEAPSAADQPLLAWQGQTETGCGALSITADYALSVGACGQPPSWTQTVRQEDTRLFLDQMAADLAPFDLKTEQGSLSFHGGGSQASPAWQRALDTWALYTFSETYTGRACAACRTALSWSLGPSPDLPEECRHLTVLNFGVAYAETGLCDTGNWTVVKRAVVESEDWESFDTWLYLYQPYNDNTNSFGGQGAQPLNEAAIARIDSWAQAVYAQVAASGQ
jgi:hypothetical protein